MFILRKFAYIAKTFPYCIPYEFLWYKKKTQPTIIPGKSTEMSRKSTGMPANVTTHWNDGENILEWWINPLECREIWNAGEINKNYKKIHRISRGIRWNANET